MQKIGQSQRRACFLMGIGRETYRYTSKERNENLKQITIGKKSTITGPNRFSIIASN